MLSEWLLLKIELAIAVLNEWRLRIFNALASISLHLARLILQLLKRTVSLIKNWLKEHKVDDWLKTILHGAYLSVFESLYVVLYILHFSTAFLNLVNYFTEQNNKNLVEITKFFFACFKMFISVLMLTFMLAMIAHGVVPIGLLAYQHIKALFFIYSYCGFAINFITLGFSFYKYKTCGDKPDQIWLKNHYTNNAKKHFEILLVALPVMITLTLISLGLVTGPWLWVIVGIASVLLLIDMAKSIYYHVNRPKVPEPKMGALEQKNSFIDMSTKDYYYRKCRSGRLKTDNIESNRIYLLKEIIVKIFLLKTKLNSCSSSRISFFSERSKIQKKIEGLKQAASHLLVDNFLENERLYDDLVKTLQKDYQNLSENDKTLIKKNQIENLINKHKERFSKETIFDELLYARDRIKEKFKKNDLIYSQAFRQSFFRKKGDCEDIFDACKVFSELQKKTDESSSLESRLSIEKPDISLVMR